MAENGNGALFKNRRKAGPMHPDYTGNFVLKSDLLHAWVQEMKNAPSGEITVQLASWIKEPKSKGDKYLSLSISAPFKKKDEGDRIQERATRKELDDDMPF